jgi:ABC-2 type transport system ATP-binding protein
VERVADIVAILHQGKLLVCLPLEQLKARLERWTVSLADGASALPHFLSSDIGLAELDHAVLDRQQNGRQIQMMVARPSADWLWKLRQLPPVSEVEVHVPSLEDIFVTCLRSGTGIADRLASIAPVGSVRSESSAVRDVS